MTALLRHLPNMLTAARLCAELWPLIKDSDWAFVGANSSFQMMSPGSAKRNLPN